MVSPVDTDYDQAKNSLRIKDVASARNIYNSLLRDNEQRSYTFAQVRNQLEGGRPYDPKDLESRGEGGLTNVNFGTARAARDRIIVPYWKMVHDVPHVVSVSVDSPAPDVDKWNAGFQEAFDLFLKDWGSDYKTNWLRQVGNYIDFGVGMAIFPDPDTNPRFGTGNVQRVYWPRGTKMSTKDWQMMLVVREMTASEMYEKIRTPKDKKASKAMGWDENALKSAMVFSCTSSSGQAFDNNFDWTKYQDLIVNNDALVTTSYSPVEIVFCYIKQFDGTIGCYAFPRVCTFQNGNSEEFIYRNDKYADGFDEFLSAIWYDTGTDAMVHSIKGFGIKNYFYSNLENRMMSKICDSAAINLSLNFKRTAEIPDEAPPVESYGWCNVFPEGLEQIVTYPQYQAAERVLQMLGNGQAENNSQYKEQSQQIGDTDTATQAKIMASMQGATNEASYSIFLSQIGEGMYSQCFKRLRKKGSSNPDAKKFVERCKKRGIPEEVIYEADIRVETGASAGMANPALRAMKFQELLQMMNAPGVNGRWILENYFAHTIGAYAVNKALLPEGEQSAPGQRRQAMMENGDFGQGMQLPVAPQDAHVEHLDEHLKPLEALIQQGRQTGQFNPEAIPAAMMTLEHSGKHLAYLQADDTKADAYRMLAKRYSQVESAIRGEIVRMERARREQQHNAPVINTQAPAGQMM